MLLGVGVFVAVAVGVEVGIFVGVRDGVTVTIIVAVGVGVGLLAHAKPPAKPTAKRNSPKRINTHIPRRMGMILNEKRIRRNWVENRDQEAGIRDLAKVNEQCGETRAYTQKFVETSPVGRLM